MFKCFQAVAKFFKIGTTAGTQEGQQMELNRQIWKRIRGHKAAILGTMKLEATETPTVQLQQNRTRGV